MRVIQVKKGTVIGDHRTMSGFHVPMVAEEELLYVVKSPLPVSEVFKDGEYEDEYSGAYWSREKLRELYAALKPMFEPSVVE